MKASAKAAVKAKPITQLEQYHRRDAMLAACASLPLPRATPLPLENYEKGLIAKDRAAKRRRNVVGA